MQRWDEAQAHLEAALAFNEKLDALPWLARTRYDYARMLLDRDASGDRSVAQALLSQALDVARGLGMTRLEEEAGELIRSGSAR